MLLCSGLRGRVKTLLKMCCSLMPARGEGGKQAIKMKSIQSHFIVDLPVQTTVRTVDLLGIQAVLMWKLS